MIQSENQLTSLPFYTALKHQDRQKWWTQSIYRLISPNSKFLPFQIIKSITEVGSTECPIPDSVDYTADFSTDIDSWTYEVAEGDVNVVLSVDSGKLLATVTNNSPGSYFVVNLKRVISETKYQYSNGTVDAVLDSDNSVAELSAIGCGGVDVVYASGTHIYGGYTIDEDETDDNGINYAVITLSELNTGADTVFYVESWTSSSVPYLLYNDDEVYQSDWSSDIDGWSISGSGTASLSAVSSELLLTYNSETSVIIQRSLSYSNENIGSFTLNVSGDNGILTRIWFIGKNTGGNSLNRSYIIEHDLSDGIYTLELSNDSNWAEFTKLIISVDKDSTDTSFSDINMSATVECVPEQSDIFTTAELIEVKTGDTTDISTYMNANVVLETFSDYQVAVYDASVALISDLDNVYMYMHLNDGVDDFYSEVFLPCDDLSEYVKVEWWRDTDLIFDYGRIVYSSGFINTMYLETDIGRPQYLYEIEETTRNGYKFVEKVTSYKRFNFDNIIPEAIIDVLSRLPNHEYITISSESIDYTVTKIEIGEPEWEDQGDLAVLMIEFETNTVISSGTSIYGAVNQLMSSETDAISIRGNSKRIYQLSDSDDLDDVYMVVDKSSYSEAVRLKVSSLFEVIEPIVKLDFDPQTVAPDYLQGRLYFDSVEDAFTYYNSVSDVSMQLGLELWVRCYNNTGDTIDNGKVVYTDTVSSNLPSVALADSNYYDKSRIIGVATHDIEDGEIGFVAFFGKVNDMDMSSFGIGDIVYLDSDGDLTDTVPSDGQYTVRVGVCLLATSLGKLQLNISTSDYTVEMLQQTGWPDRSNITMAFDDGTLTFSVTPTDANNTRYYEKGTKYFVESAGDSIIIDDTSGIHLIYYIDGVISEIINPTLSQEVSIYENYPVLTSIYWRVGDRQIYMADKAHNSIGYGSKHIALEHATGGAIYSSGLGLDDFVVDGNGSSDTHAQFSIEAGTIRDSDILSSTPAVASTVGVDIVYLDSSLIWERATNSGFSVLTTGTGRLAYQDITSGGLVECDNNTYVLYFIAANNDYTSGNRVISMPGAAFYSSAADAEGAIDSEIAQIYPSIPIGDFVLVGAVIFQTRDSYSNSVKARIVSTLDGLDYVDKREFAGTGGTSGTTSPVFKDTDFKLFDDTTLNELQFELDELTANRIITVPDSSGEMVLDVLNGVESITGSASNQEILLARDLGVTDYSVNLNAWDSNGDVVFIRLISRSTDRFTIQIDVDCELNYIIKTY